MISFTSVSPVVVRSPYGSALSRLSPSANAAQSIVEDRFSSLQRRELGKIIDQLDELESTLRSSGTAKSNALLDAVSNQTSVQSNLLALGPGAAISEGLSPNLVANGSLEETAVEGRFKTIREVDGWSNVNGFIEVWRDLVQSADGMQNIELDVRPTGPNDTLSQTVVTEPGQAYELSFAFAPRPGVSFETNSFEVFFDGVKLDTIGAEGGSIDNLDWRMYSFTVEASAAESEILFRETLSDGKGALIDAVSLRGSDNPVGTSTVRDLAMGGTVLSDSGIQSGSIVINGQVINVDVDNDSLQDIVDSINSAQTGVTASLTSVGSVSADPLELYQLELSSDEAGFTVADNGTGLFAAMGVQTGAYGEVEVYETATSTARKRRGYRAADALEKIQQSLQRIAESDVTVGRASIQSTLTSIFDGLVDRHSSERLSALGLDIVGLEEGFLDISDQSRRRFSKAVYEDESLLEKMLLDTYDRNEEGLIEVLRETIKAELASDGALTGSVINTFA